MFNVFKKILNINSNFSQEELDKVKEFVLCRWLCGNAGLVNVANTLNYYHKIPKDIQVKFIQNVINGKVRFIPYPKSIKEQVGDANIAVRKFFNVSEREANNMLEFLTEEEMKVIKEYYNDSLHS